MCGKESFWITIMGVFGSIKKAWHSHVVSDPNAALNAYMLYVLLFFFSSFLLFLNFLSFLFRYICFGYYYKLLLLPIRFISTKYPIITFNDYIISFLMTITHTSVLRGCQPLDWVVLLLSFPLLLSLSSESNRF